MKKMLSFYLSYKDRQRQINKNSEFDIRFYNFWDQDNPDMWLFRFINARKLLKEKGKSVCFYSTFGRRDIINYTKGDVNIFFTGENLKKSNHSSFADHFLNESLIDFAIGFERFEDPRYIRLPLWIMYMFNPESSEDEIIKRCEELRFPQRGHHNRFACHVSSEDDLGLRKSICKQLSKIEPVDCAGKVLHNCDDLWKFFGDDKMKFISEYKFNICPENSNCMGYVTEKLFQAIDAGCIPVYWGSFNDPEPEVLNHDAIVFWEKDGNNESVLELIEQLNNSPKLFEDFAQQARLKDNASDFVIRKFNDLESHIKNLL